MNENRVKPKCYCQFSIILGVLKIHANQAKNT